ncbi:EcoRII N-terminal effector-binding domain-containing protein [Arenimonas caeni]|nr:EcoRII N-terminal effector-binding domain-containing protein [Arenimonas caeni]
MQRRIAKILSANDTGETGGHQAGILVPKEESVLSFFPPLDESIQNPRCHLRFLDGAGTFWEFAFIYYNNRLYGGTRNEYRLTRMTKFIRQAGLVQGDELLLTREGSRYCVDYRRKRAASSGAAGVLKLGTGWRVVEINR